MVSKNAKIWSVYDHALQITGNKSYAYALFAQALHETGNGKSNLYKKHNACFGMNAAQKRTKFYTHTVANAEGEKAGYSSILYSVMDRIDLDKYFRTPFPQEGNPVTFYMQDVLSKGYATDPAYLGKWQQTFFQLLQSEGYTDAEISMLAQEYEQGDDYGGGATNTYGTDILVALNPANWTTTGYFIAFGIIGAIAYWKYKN